MRVPSCAYKNHLSCLLIHTHTHTHIHKQAHTHKYIHTEPLHQSPAFFIFLIFLLFATYFLYIFSCQMLIYMWMFVSKSALPWASQTLSFLWTPAVLVLSYGHITWSLTIICMLVLTSYKTVLHMYPPYTH